MVRENIKVLLQHIFPVSPIVVLCGPKQQLQNCLSKASFMLFLLPNQRSGNHWWKYTYKEYARSFQKYTYLEYARSFRACSDNFPTCSTAGSGFSSPRAYTRNGALRRWPGDKICTYTIRFSVEFTYCIFCKPSLQLTPFSIHLGYTGGRIFLAIVAKFFINMAFSGIYIWSAELFPTFVR